MNEEKLL